MVKSIRVDKNGREFKVGDIIKFKSWVSTKPEYYVFDGEMIKLPRDDNEIIGNVNDLGSSDHATLA